MKRTAINYVVGLVVAFGIAWPNFIYDCQYCWWCIECWIFTAAPR